MSKAILGISAYYHDSAAVLVVDGRVAAAAQEERFSRKKHDPAFPSQSLEFVLDHSGIAPGDLEAIAFYDKPLLKFERLLETYHALAPRGLRSFLAAMPVWAREKLLLRQELRKEFRRFGLEHTRLVFPEHHLSHAASAFFPSPFRDSAILTIDGVGEWATATIGHGRDNEITVMRELTFPHSPGLLYSAFTEYCGFRVNSGEYKLMGLAPYGHVSARTERWKRLVLDEMVDLRPDGSFLLNMDYFNFATGVRMCHLEAWRRLFGIPKREPECGLAQEYMDLARVAQEVIEKIILRLSQTARDLSGSPFLSLAGGVALNCVANGKLLRKGIFRDLWIQPAAGDAGGALGAALAAWHIWRGSTRVPRTPDAMEGALLGPEFGDAEIRRTARRQGARYEYFSDFSGLCRNTAGILAAGQVVGWFQGPMEFGPRALGNRSILGDARDPAMQKRLNLKIKFRESFRPFAPAVLAEDCQEYFELDRPSPYMLLVADVVGHRRKSQPQGGGDEDVLRTLYHARSDLPAVTHVDYSARVQTVHEETNPRFWKLLTAFKEKTGYGVVVNTSFNVRGEPIVCTPEDAYRCFMNTEMDVLVMGNFVFKKEEQPEWSRPSPAEEVFPPD